jgi:putative endopeptidase
MSLYGPELPQLTQQDVTMPFERPAPSEDFNGWINGEWEASTTIPDDQNRWGSFMILREENLERCRALCEDAENNATVTGQLYWTAMTPVENTPDALEDLLRSVELNVNDSNAFLAQAGELFQLGVSSFLHLCKSEDAKNPELRVPHISQAGLGLPDKSYYTDRLDLHQDYKGYISSITQTFGRTVNAEEILSLEKKIAELHLTRVERRDPHKVYNNLPWETVRSWLPEFFDHLNIYNHCEMRHVIVESPPLVEGLREVISRTDPQVLREYLVFQICNKFAPLSTEKAIDIHFSFHGTRLSGNKAIEPRWKRSVAVVERFIGDELGKLYVAKYFPAEKQQKCLEMVNELKGALGETLRGLGWMTDATKKEALSKLDRFGVKVGVPEQWHDIDGLWADGLGESLVRAAMRWYAWDWHHQEVRKFYTPPERKLWHMTPQTVNAYYHPEMNEIVFPAGILQVPFFGFDSFEENIGAIGVVIGHEMTHGFDDQGRQYDSEGRLRDWWTEEDSKEFTRRAKVVEDHYARQIVCGKHVDGKLTLGENIADIGGIKLALRALKSFYKSQMTRDHLVRFFESYAKIWRMVIREEMALKLLAIDPHSPSHLRINAALGHVEEFYQTYGVREGDKMFVDPEARMDIW